MANTFEPIYYTARRAPSAKTLETALSIDSATARRVKAILSGRIDLMTIEAARRRQEEAYSDHKPVTLALEACNEVLGTHGVEYLRSRDDSINATLGVDYLNVGETYQPTLQYDNRADLWRVACWGSYVEANPRRFWD